MADRLETEILAMGGDKRPHQVRTTAGTFGAEANALNA